MASSGITPKRTCSTGAEFIAYFLERQGIQIVAGIPGGSALPVYGALSRSTQIRHIPARHEQRAGFIAQGMTRTDGKLTACMVCNGLGATNLVTAIVDARLDSIPLVCIAGRAPASIIGIDASQEVDTYGISIPITRHNYLVRHISELPQIMSDVFHIAQSGHLGPVWIDIPRDIQTVVFDIEKTSESAQKMVTPEFSRDSTRDVAAIINVAQRPVLYLNGSVISAPGRMRELVEKTTLPTIMTLMVLDMSSKAYPLSLGMPGMHGARSTNSILQEVDLSIVLGTRFDNRAIGKTEQFHPDARITHVDIDRAEPDKTRQPHVVTQADVDGVLVQLIPLIGAQPQELWYQMVADLQHELSCVIPQESDLLSHYGLINAMTACVDDSVIITTDVGQYQMWAAQAYPLSRPRQWLTSGGLGTMGFGLPVAIGAVLANPGKRVLYFSGDSSLMINVQETATANENQLDIEIILMNDEVLGLVYQQQSLFYKQGVFVAIYPRMINFMQMAAGFGLETCDLSNETDPQAALQEIINHPGPVLIHVRIDAEQKVYPVVPSGAASTEMVGE